MARVTHVKKAQQRYETVPVRNEDGSPKTIPVMRRNGEPKLTKSGRPIVRKVTVEDRSKPLPNRRCEKCGAEIAVGDPYKWIKPKSGPYGGRVRVRCVSCPRWRPSETTSSAALSTLYGAQEAAEDELAAWDRYDLSGLESLLDDLASGVREAGEVYRESAQNMEDGFGHSTYLSDELNEKADALESAADEVESAKDNLEEFDEDSARSEVEDDVLAEYLTNFDLSEVEGPTSTLEEASTNVPDFDPEVYEQLIEDAVQEKRDEWADEQYSKVEDALANVEV